jgi:5'-nucleotidase
MISKEIQILLTNDDGILSPGLWAAAKALSTLGFVTVAAPREQYSGAGRSFPATSDGNIEKKTLQIGDEEWQVYAIGGTPAQAVTLGILAIMPVKPDLVVSGINYGENPGTDITMSGTIGAAMEGASFGIPSLAMSLQLQNVNVEFLHHSRKVDFSAAAHFTAFFGRMLLEGKFPKEVDLVKVDVPTDATPQTEWRIARLTHERYFTPVIEREGAPGSPAVIGSHIEVTAEKYEPGTDVYVMAIDKQVAVTPLTLDMTARVDLEKLEKKLKG